jgi:hypothetical protein
METNKKERENLMKMPGDIKQMSSVSWLSKHVSPISMGTPLEGNKFGKAMADNDGDYEKAKASMAPQMNKSAVYKQGYNAKLDESLGTKNGKKSQSLKDRRDESKGMEKSKGKGAYSSDSKMS